jgi:hypothetical protein
MPHALFLGSPVRRCLTDVDRPVAHDRLGHLGGLLSDPADPAGYLVDPHAGPGGLLSGLDDPLADLDGRSGGFDGPVAIAQHSLLSAHPAGIVAGHDAGLLRPAEYPGGRFERRGCLAGGHDGLVEGPADLAVCLDDLGHRRCLGRHSGRRQTHFPTASPLSRSVAFSSTSWSFLSLS